MRSTMASKLTRAYLEQPARDNYIATAATIVIVTLSIFWMVFRVGGSSATALFAGIAYVVSAFLGALWALRTAYMVRSGPLQLGGPYPRIWLLIGLALLVSLCARVIFILLSSTSHEPFPGSAGVFFNLFYLSVFTVLLRISSTIRFRLRVCLDALIAVLSFFGICWFFFIGPTYVLHAGHIPWAEIIKLAALLIRPCWDILLVLTIILLFQHKDQHTPALSFVLFIIAMLSITWSDLAFAYISIFDTYQLGALLVDPFQNIGYLLIGLSGLYQYAALARKKYVEMASQLTEVSVGKKNLIRPNTNRHLRVWLRLSAILINLPLTLLLVLTVYSEFTSNDLVSRWLVVFAVVVGVLISARYFLANYENQSLLQERKQRHDESERLRHLMTQLTEILDEESLREHIVSMVTHELEFDAAMLLLIESQHTPEQLSQLLVYATSIPGMKKQRWLFQGDNLLRQLASDDEVYEMQWAYQFLVPSEVRLWCQEQHIANMAFLPLIYQGHVLGSLGVTRRDKIHLSHDDVALVKKYTEQVTAVIEHVHLYKEAREHEEFSRAMTTIATRLNAAVVEPAEISQVICKEGANILRADYTFFYSVDGERRLMPLAGYVRERDTPLPLQDWPLIRSYEYEAQALYSMQPMLLHIPPQEFAHVRDVSSQVLPLSVSSLRKNIGNKQFHLRSSESQDLPSLRLYLARYYIQTIILAPVIANGEPVGLLIFARSQPPGVVEKRPFTLADLAQTQDFVEQAAVPFVNARLYQDLQTAHQRLQELDQLKDQFMVTASHELRTPLTAVQGYIELLAQFDDQLPWEQRREFLQKACRGCEELVVLLGNVMDASRLEIEAGIKPALLTRVSVQEMIESVQVLIEPQITQEQRIVHTYIQPALFVLADPPRLRQVLMNVTVNALKYSPPQTPIVIYAQTTQDQQQPCVIISISDKGKGIASEDQARLFQRFVRLESDVNSPVRGSGLGLYISRRLIEAMGGKISIESKGIPGKGTIFHIQLPIAR